MAVPHRRVAGSAPALKNDAEYYDWLYGSVCDVMYYDWLSLVLTVGYLGNPGERGEAIERQELKENDEKVRINTLLLCVSYAYRDKALVILSFGPLSEWKHF